MKDGKYWDRAWSLVEGCTPVSEACENCWLRSMNDRFKKGGFSYVRIQPNRIYLPLHARKPTVWAVWSDLFHVHVPFDFIDDAMSTMFDDLRHTYLILTKRPERVIDFYKSYNDRHYWGIDRIWFGTTAENQRTADERIPHLLKVPGNKFLSIEPMLSEINLHKWLWENCPSECVSASHAIEGHRVSTGAIQAIILGGESGPKARPMHPDWVRDVRDQCAAAGVPFFFKQWGEWSPFKKISAPYGVLNRSGNWFPWTTAWNGKIGKDSVTNEVYMYRIGKKATGRTLDSRTHDDLPWIT